MIAALCEDDSARTAWKDGALDSSPSAGILRSTTEARLCHTPRKDESPPPTLSHKPLPGNLILPFLLRSLYGIFYFSGTVLPAGHISLRTPRGEGKMLF